MARIFNTYSPRMAMDDGRVVSNFVAQALEGKPWHLRDGTQTRSFQYVSDLVAGLMALMDNDVGFISPVNLGNPGEFTMLELAEKVRAVVDPGEDCLLRKHRRRSESRKPDISLARETRVGTHSQVGGRFAHDGGRLQGRIEERAAGK